MKIKYLKKNKNRKKNKKKMFIKQYPHQRYYLKQ